jgi:type II secretory pathway pseudopilin PulG
MSNSLVRKFVSRDAMQAFTLLELLVVITIIIILISFLFPAFRGVQDQAKRTQAKNDLSQIVTAINAFYTEYGKYPTAAVNDAVATYGSAANNNILFDVLRYDTSRDSATVTSLNPRQVVFIEPPTAKDQTLPKLGIKATTGIWYDTWGVPYKVTNYANYNAVTNAPSYSDLGATYTILAPDTGVRTGVIAWSFGADGTQATNYKDPVTGVQSDDVISWQ